MPEILPSVCPHDCPSACALVVERHDGERIGRVRGGALPYTAGVCCAKVARYAERVHHPDRLLHPLRRTGPKGSGCFERISWDEALDVVAEAFRGAACRHGGESVWPFKYAGTMGLVQRDGIARLRHALRYSRQRNTICSSLAGAGWQAGVGGKWGVDAREMLASELIVVWGGNPVATQVNLMHWIAQARRVGGARLVVVDPYRTPTAEKADLHVMLRPGTDGALACAMMHVLFRDGLADRDYMRRYTDVPDALEAHLAARTPDWAAAITGIPAAEIEAFARLYGSTRRSFLRLGYGFTRSRNGAANMHAVSCLPSVTGAWSRRGGGALHSSSGLFGLDTTLIEGLDVLDPATRALDMSRVGAVLCGEAADLGGGPPVTAMLIQNQNPVTVAPDTLAVRRGFAREDLFVCVHEQFMTETARMADVVLPATTFLEHDDLYAAYGHGFLQVAKAVIPPRGEARSNHEVLCGLAMRLGAEHPGFAMSGWELVEATLRASGLPGADEIHAIGWLDRHKPFTEAHFLDGFPHPDGRFHFRADWAAVGADFGDMPPLPDHLANIDEADEERPFRLVTAPSRHFLNSTFSEAPTSRRLADRPTALVHPEDCRALGLAEGDRLRIGNRQASVVVHAQPFEGLRRGIVVVESVWPNAAFAEGLGINALVSADAGPPLGGAVFHDVAVWLRREGEA